MKHVLTLVFIVFAATPGLTQESDAAPEGPVFVQADGVNLSDFSWLKRPLVIFADTPNDPRFVEQMGYISERFGALEERDVVVIIDTDPEARTAIRRDLRPRGFGLVLIGKDGVIHLRKPAPWHVREITRTIDKLPVRQQELRDARPGRS